MKKPYDTIERNEKRAVRARLGSSNLLFVYRRLSTLHTRKNRVLSA